MNSQLTLTVSNTNGTSGDRTTGAPGAGASVDASAMSPYQRTFRFGLTAFDVSTRVEIQASNDNVHWQSISTFAASASIPDESLNLNDNSFYYRTLRVAGNTASSCVLTGTVR